MTIENLNYKEFNQFTPKEKMASDSIQTAIKERILKPYALSDKVIVPSDKPVFLYHGTSSYHIQGIIEKGL